MELIRQEQHRWEKRNIALEVPVWDEEICIQCNKCVIVCPHATIRAKVYEEKYLANAPATFKHTKFKGKGLWRRSSLFTTGCS